MLDDTKIYLVTFQHCSTTLVSHGVGNNSLRNVCLPPEPLQNFKPLRDEQGLYIPVEAPGEGV